MQHAERRLTTAYSVCRHIARTSAKNFYYGFMLLPAQKRDALSAVYAFMRHADDLSDDPGMQPGERRAKLADFINSYHQVLESGRTDDPVLLALRDSQQRFEIPTELLDKLVAGTGMDVREDGEPAAGPLVVYRSFDELYDYCYHVASVVGLVCIRIFGYRDPAAEQHAEHLGIAFQLTNILRDVKEDAAMARVYLPQEDLERFGVSAEELGSGVPLENLRPLLAFEAARAREFYISAERLLPLIDEVSQPALWAMVEIYRGILDRIELRQFDVYSERVRLSLADKLKVLAKGFRKRLL
ncbi:MAG: farnesyl-diphosphate farnesyltransferase [Acidobacteria bacterium]|nr:MAG: farnesyl-diphosphate farnesyltransferase [Acidobacteriota bacterium]